MNDRFINAPAAHLVTVEPAAGGGGVTVGHLLCDLPPVLVLNVPGQPYVRVIDVIQAVLGHRCPEDTVR